MKNIRQKLIIVGSAIIAVVVVTIIILFFQKKSPITQMQLAITSSTPAGNSIGVSVFDPVTITFNQNVNASDFTAASDPGEDWTIIQSSPNTIEIDHKLYLRVFTDYKLTVFQHSTTVDVISFQTAQEQNDPRLLQTIQSQTDKDYPLASLLPYENSYYRVVYSAPLTLEIDLKGSGINPQDAITQVQQWVKSNGVDPATHKYIVVAATVTSTPSASPTP